MPARSNPLRRATKKRTPGRPKPVRPRRRQAPPSKDLDEEPAEPESDPIVLSIPDAELVEESAVASAQDAVSVLRRELAFQAELSRRKPGTMPMSDVIALLKLLTDIAPTAMKQQIGQRANFEALNAAERELFAALLAKVQCA